MQRTGQISLYSNAYISEDSISRSDIIWSTSTCTSNSRHTPRFLSANTANRTSTISWRDCPVSNIFATTAVFQFLSFFCQSLGKEMAFRYCSDLHPFDCYWSWSSFYTRIVSITKIIPTVIGPCVNSGGGGEALGIPFALYPSVLGCRLVRAVCSLVLICLHILYCSSSRVPKGSGVLVSMDVTVVWGGQRSCTVRDHLPLSLSFQTPPRWTTQCPPRLCCSRWDIRIRTPIWVRSPTPTSSSRPEKSSTSTPPWRQSVSAVPPLSSSAFLFLPDLSLSPFFLLLFLFFRSLFFHLHS